MTETATVKSVGTDTVSVVCKTAESCKGCSGLFCSADAHEIRTANPSALTVTPGDVVVIDIPPGRTVFQGFIVLILPLILFIVSFFIGGKVYPSASEAVKVLFGLFGLAAGFGFSFLYGKFRKDQSRPVILSVKKAAAGTGTDGLFQKTL